MNLELSGVRDAGDIERERVVMTAAADVDVGDYAIFNCELGKTGKVLAGNVRDVYWFMNKKIKKGDLVILYSKKGASGEKNNDDGTKSHFFYWRDTHPIWTPGRVPVLVETPVWKRGDVINEPTDPPAPTP